MREYRPDLAFVVTAEVWRDFLRVREETGDALCNGFLWTCESHVKAAEESGETAQARHWKAVLNLANHYGISFISAIEVDGVVIREQEKYSLWEYPEDADLTRLVIDADTIYMDSTEPDTFKLRPVSAS